MSSELLHYEDVKFRREGREILKGINWHVEEGENWALLGLNGAGKSTMLSMIPAYQIPTTGLLRVFGHEFGKYAWPKIKARLGFVSSALGQFQSTLDK
ncbi:MAG: ATP-binding cassette domain-containing protein, partial [Veillonella sp.]